MSSESLDELQVATMKVAQQASRANEVQLQALRGTIPQHNFTKVEKTQQHSSNLNLLLCERCEVATGARAHSFCLQLIFSNESVPLGIVGPPRIEIQPLDL
eukprot:2426502-Amphidinium_carterae.2